MNDGKAMMNKPEDYSRKDLGLDQELLVAAEPLDAQRTAHEEVEVRYLCIERNPVDRAVLRQQDVTDEVEKLQRRLEKYAAGDAEEIITRQRDEIERLRANEHTIGSWILSLEGTYREPVVGRVLRDRKSVV